MVPLRPGMAHEGQLLGLPLSVLWQLPENQLGFEIMAGKYGGFLESGQSLQSCVIALLLGYLKAHGNPML